MILKTSLKNKKKMKKVPLTILASSIIGTIICILMNADIVITCIFFFVSGFSSAIFLFAFLGREILEEHLEKLNKLENDLTENSASLD